MKYIPTAIALALTCNIAVAQESWFEVELILFERHGEQSQQIPHLTPRPFVAPNALDVITAQLNPRFDDCPVLTQQQRFELANSTLQSTLATPPVAAQDIPSLPVDDTGQQELDTLKQSEEIRCHAPDEVNLAQAYEIRAQRLADRELARSLIPELNQERGQQPSQTLAESPFINDSQSSFVTDDLDVTMFDATTFVPYPLSFSVNDIDYVSVPAYKETPLNNVPPTIASDSLVTESPTTYLLPLENLELLTLAKKMKWQKSMTPILHLGWRQPVYARHLAKQFSLFGGANFSSQFNNDGSEIVIDDVSDQEIIQDVEPAIAADVLTMAPADSLAFSLAPDLTTVPAVDVLPSTSLDDILDELALSSGIEPTVKPLWQLDGLLKIYLNRFLFIETDFELRRPGITRVVARAEVSEEDVEGVNREVNTNTSLDGSISLITAPESEVVENLSPQMPTDVVEVPWLTSARLKQNRRVRSKEIHYFDHPDFGMVIQIRRFKRPPEITL